MPHSNSCLMLRKFFLIIAAAIYHENPVINKIPIYYYYASFLFGVFGAMVHSYKIKYKIWVFCWQCWYERENLFSVKIVATKFLILIGRLVLVQS